MTFLSAASRINSFFVNALQNFDKIKILNSEPLTYNLSKVAKLNCVSLSERLLESYGDK